VNLVEYEENVREKQKDTNIQDRTQTPPSNQAIRMGNTMFPLQRSKTSPIKGFGENISQLSLCINVSHLDVSLLNMVSQEVVSPLKVSHSFVEDWVFGYRDGTGVVAHEGNSLKDHSEVSHSVHTP
jgi:hypothetical protein